MENQIKKAFNPITVDEVKASQYKDHLLQAQVRQTVTTTYPSKRVGNSLSDSLFSTENFGIADGQSFNSTRVTWVDVPLNTTKAQVEELLAQKPNARIQRIISNDVMDVLTDEQKSAIERGVRTVAEYKESLRVKDGNGVDLPGTPQYRQYFFKTTAVEDIDLRVAVPANSVQANANIEADMHA